MRAWLLHSLDGLDALRLEEAPDPTPGRDEIVLDVRFAALNPADRYLAEGQYPARPALPHILGRDGVGTVSAAGEGAEGFAVGEKALVLRGPLGVERAGTLAEKVAAPLETLARVPDGWSDEEAAGAPLVYLTAYQCLMQWGELPRDAVVLVPGASGGVGLACVHLAKALGWTVAGLSRSEEKREIVRGEGADLMLDAGDDAWPKKLLERLGGRRVDLAIDNLGGPFLPKIIATLGHGGRVSVVGRLAGPVPEFNTATLFFRRLRLGGVAVGTYSREEAQEVWGRVVGLLARTGKRPLVDRVFPHTELRAAFDRLAEGPMGKVLVGFGEA